MAQLKSKLFRRWICLTKMRIFLNQARQKQVRNFLPCFNLFPIVSISYSMQSDFFQIFRNRNVKRSTEINFYFLNLRHTLRKQGQCLSTKIKKIYVSDSSSISTLSRTQSLNLPGISGSSAFLFHPLWLNCFKYNLYCKRKLRVFRKKI